MPQKDAAEDKNNSDIKEMSFEQALAELEGIVHRLESGQGALEESIQDYTRGTALKAHCAEKLASARLQVEKIVTQSDGTLTTEPLDAEA